MKQKNEETKAFTEKKVLELEKHVSDINKTLTSLEQELDASSILLKEKDMEILEILKKSELSSTKVGDLEREIQNLSDKLTYAHQRTEEKDREIKKVWTKLDESDRIIANKESFIQNNWEKLASTSKLEAAQSKELHELKRENNNNIRELEKLQKKYDTSIEELQKKNSEYMHLHESLLAKDTLIRDLNSKKQEIDEQLALLHKMHSTAEKQATSWHLKFNAVSKENEFYTHHLWLKNNEIERLKSELESLFIEKEAILNSVTYRIGKLIRKFKIFVPNFMVERMRKQAK